MVTGARGYYEFKNLNKGMYKVEVRATGYMLSVNKNVEVEKEFPELNSKIDGLSGSTRLNVVLLPEKSKK